MNNKIIIDGGYCCLTKKHVGMMMHHGHNVGKTAIHHPFRNGKHTTYKNRDDWGMVYEIV